MRTKKCQYCPKVIGFIKAATGGTQVVRADPFMREGEDPLPKGKYLDEFGTMYGEGTAPVGVEVYRVHWDECPGAAVARKR